MKVALFGRNFAEDRFVYFQRLLEVMERSGLSVCVYKPFYDFIDCKFVFSRPPDLYNNHHELCEQAEMLISVGGDGTILDAVTLVRDSGIPIMGVNLGRMGFLSGIPRNEIDGAIRALAEGAYSIEKRALLHIESPQSLFGDLDFALNELTINKKDTGSMILVHVYVNDLLLNSYWADGLIVATPTGSTAYSLSCNGPIITPDSENFVITPIASHNLTVRPVVIPDKSIIRINVEGRLTHYLVGLDSRYTVMDSSVEIVVRKENFTVNMVQIHGNNFFNTIRQKLLWGQDVRFHETTL
ncbi:MAG: NAD kinase [Lentimicrobiaceae bacterium]|nr:NAD kinase [Lentimicrobiaceae bacterium]